jgi:hypothetical protein
MPFNIRVGGAWKAGTGAKVKVGGAWKTVESIQVKVGGAWKVAFTNSISPKITATVTPNPSNFSQDVTISGFVLPVPTGGTVLVRTSGGNPVGTSDTVDTTTGEYSITIPDQAVGTYAFSVNYSGSGIYQPDSTNVTVNVGTIPTTTTLTRSAASYVYNATRVTLSGTVSPTPLTGGTVTISSTSQGTIGTATVNTLNGGYSLLVPVKDVGSYIDISALYGGSGNYAQSFSGTTSYSVTQAATALTASTSAASVQAGSAVTLSGNLSSASVNLDGRTVTFQGLNSSSIWVNLGTGATNASGNANFVWTSVAGYTQIRAVYAGETNYSGQTSTGVAITVTTAVATNLIASVGSTTPVAGSAVTLSGTLTISSSGSAISGRSLTFQGLSSGIWTNLGTGSTNASGTASFAWVAVAGYTQIRAVYAGEANYLAQTSAGVAITVQTNITTTTSIARSASTYAYNGTRVTISGTVSPAPSGGTVTISGSINGATATNFATSVAVNTSTGAYSAVMPVQNAGSYTSVTATYGGSGLYLTSASGTTSYTVTQAATAITSTPSFDVNDGAAATLSTNLKTGGANFSGQSITFQARRRSDGAWINAGSNTTDANGNASISWTTNNAYDESRAVYTATTNYAGATSTGVAFTTRGRATRTITAAQPPPGEFWYWRGSIGEAHQVGMNFTAPAEVTGANQYAVYRVDIAAAGRGGNQGQIRACLWNSGSGGALLTAGPAVNLASQPDGNTSYARTAFEGTNFPAVAFTPGTLYKIGFWRRNNSTSFSTQWRQRKSTGRTTYWDDSESTPGGFDQNQTFSGDSLDVVIYFEHYIKNN